MSDVLALPQLRLSSAAFPALAVGVGVVPVPSHGAGIWVDILAGHVPGSPEARKAQNRAARALGGLDGYLERELQTLRDLPDTWIVRVIARVEFTGGRRPVTCALDAALPFSVIARWEALEVVGARIAERAALLGGAVVPVVEGFDGRSSSAG